MHDAVMGEQRGIPATGVMTEQFVDAAELMGSVLGAEGFPFVVIEHPIASATPDELAARAARAAKECAAILTGLRQPAAPGLQVP